MVHWADTMTWFRQDRRQGAQAFRVTIKPVDGNEEEGNDGEAGKG